MPFLINLSMLLFVALSIAYSGCGDNTSAYVIKPPPVPPGYGVFYAAPQGGSIMWKKDPRAILWDQAVVPLDVVRVGIVNGVIFGIHEDPKTKAQTGFYVDTNSHAVTLNVPVAELNERLKSVFAITNFDTVPARFYAENVDGGPR